MDVLLAGDDDQATELESALRERGLDAHRFGQTADLSVTLVALEEVLQRERPRLSLGVGSGDASLALAITALKLAVPFAAWLDGAPVDQPDERRILGTLSEPSAIVGDDVSAAAERIAVLLEAEPPARDLDSPS
jgi:hypothetical protein